MNQYGYQHISFGGSLTPMVKRLMIACGVGFLLEIIVGTEMISIFGLTPALVWSKGYLWQVVSYLFLHSPVDPFHLVWNLLALYFFGCEMERRWGSRFFLKYFFVTGIGAAFFTLCLTPTMIMPTIGASGAIYGILLAFALYYPNQTVYFMFLLPIKVKYFVLIVGLMTFYMSFSQAGGGIAHLAHLGGMVCGFFFLKPEIMSFYVRPLIQDLKAKWRRRRYRVVKKDKKKGNGKDDSWRMH